MGSCRPLDHSRHAAEHRLDPVAVILATQPVVPAFGEQPGNTFIDALAALARHLLARYGVPEFMDSVWFQGAAPEATVQQGWFRHLGLGENIRRADLPLPLTKRMAHRFMQTPGHFTTLAALRWGQVRGLGGDARLVHAVLTTRLAGHFEDEDFWAGVLRWLAAARCSTRPRSAR